MTFRRMLHSRRNMHYDTNAMAVAPPTFCIWRGSCKDARGPDCRERPAIFETVSETFMCSQWCASPDAARGLQGGSRVYWLCIRTWNISPAPSASLAVMMGVCTYRNPLSCRVGKQGHLQPTKVVSGSTAAGELVQTR